MARLSEGWIATWGKQGCSPASLCWRQLAPPPCCTTPVPCHLSPLVLPTGGETCPVPIGTARSKKLVPRAVGPTGHLPPVPQGQAPRCPLRGHRAKSQLLGPCAELPRQEQRAPLRCPPLPAAPRPVSPSPGRRPCLQRPGTPVRSHLAL